MVASTQERPVEVRAKNAKFVKLNSEEARIGMEVRVRDDHANPDLRGLIGTVEHVWGHPSYVAVDVRMANGHLGLFWYYQLEKAER